MRFLVGFLLFLLSVPLYAVQLESLYTAEVAVANQSQSVRNMAIKKALHIVVRKVSGRRSALSNAPLLSALSNVGSYVEQFQYKKREQNKGYWLIVRFQKTALDRTLQQFEVPVWGANRPDVLLWLAVDDGKKRYIANAELNDKLVALIKQESLGAGLVVTLPLLDLADQKALNFNDVWAGFSEQIQRASRRYSAKQVIFGRLLKSQGVWRFNWTLMNEGQQNDGVEKSADGGIIFQQVFAQVAENLADIYAPMGVVRVENQLKMEVVGVNDLPHFVRVTSYLSSLDMVKKLSWEQLIDNKMILDLIITGDEAVLIDTIALNDVISPSMARRNIEPVPLDISGVPTQLPEQTLYYRAN
ncbi:MAG: DUF2066 domain-containing protein [Cycloclasticus sp.]|nr:DUF2066 domain-containing protein [Cycloclasticus sp.]